MVARQGSYYSDRETFAQVMLCVCAQARTCTSIARERPLSTDASMQGISQTIHEVMQTCEHPPVNLHKDGLLFADVDRPMTLQLEDPGGM